MAKISFEKLKGEYTHLLETMVVKPEWRQAINKRVKTINDNKKRYQTIEKATNVPWYFIGLIHYRESACNFNTHLHNGDPLTKRTRQVPRGYPKTGTPPFTFEESAIDALKHQGLTGNTDWSPERMAYLLEAYNGWGYRTLRKPINSPYLWSGTNHYTKGKYIRDGKYSSTAVDQQLGLMSILVALRNPKKVYVEAKKTVEKTSTKVQVGDYLKWITSMLTAIGLAWNQVWEWADANKLYIIAALVVGFIVYVEWNKRRTIRDYIEGRFFGSKTKDKREGKE